MAYSKGRRLSVLVDTTGALQDPPVLTFLGITDGSANQVLKTDGSGNLSFTTISSDKITEGNTEVEVTDSGSNGTITLKTEGTNRWQVTNAGHILPVADNAYDIGSSSFKIRDIYVSDGSIKMGSDTVLSVSSGEFQINDASGDPKKLIVDQIELGTGDDKVILKKGSDGNMEQQSKSSGSAGTARKPFLLGVHNTGDLTEDSGAKFFTEARSRGAVSVGSNSGHGSLAYNSSSGSFTFTGVTTAAIRGLISVTGSGLSYNSSTGVLTSSVAVSSVNSQTGAVSLTTANIAENTNLYYTDARARGAISVSGNAISYNSSTGVITASYEENPVFTNGLTVGSSSAGVALSSAGSIELTRTAGSADPFIDFKDSGSDDFDARVQMDDNKLLFKTGGNGNNITALTLAATTSTDSTINSNLVVTGNFTVQGTTTTTNSANLAVTDTQITVAKNAANASAANNAGLIVDGPSTQPSFTYTSADDRWNMNKTLNATLVGNVTGNLTGNAGSATRLINNRNFIVDSVNHGFDGQANVDLTEAIQDLVGAMFTSNTDTGITSTYVDSSGKISLVVGTQSSNDFTTTLKNKLDGIESSATADQTASEILTLIKTVDGAGSGLDADTLDTLSSGNFFRNTTNIGSTDTNNLTVRGVYGNSSESSNQPFDNNAGTIIHLDGRDSNYKSQIFQYSSGGDLYVRGKHGGSASWSGWSKVWHEGNDGAGSGLNADTLDGVQLSNIARTDTGETFTSTLQVNNDLSIGTTGADTELNVKYGQIIGGFGARTTGGTTDWNDSTNARSGNGRTLLFGNATNGPGVSGQYFHPFSFEYAGYAGGGNMTQFAIPYSEQRMFFRSRYNGNWTGWRELWNSANDGAGSGLDADLLDGQHGAVYLKSPSNVSGWQNSDRNFSVRTGGDAVGLHMEESDGTFGFQLYANGGAYGFLDGEWAAWDIKKTNNGALQIDVGSGLETVATQTWVNAQGYSSAGVSLSANNTFTGSNSFSNVYNEFGNGVGSVSNDGSWHGRVNVAGTSHARIDAKAVGDGIITTMYSHNGHGSGKVGTMSNHPLGLMVNGSVKATLGSGGNLDATSFSAPASEDYGKFQLWGDSATYAIGMVPGYDYGWLADYAMTFQFNNEADRGFAWRHSGMAKTDAAMTLSTAGNLSVKNAIGFGDQTTYYMQDGSWGWRHKTPSGYIEFGPANTSHAHIYTDRSNFYFNVTALYANGSTIWHAGNDGSGSGLDADTLDSLELHTGRNNEANKVVRTDANGYIQAGWINTTSGDRGSTLLDRVYASNDGYLRYYDLASFRSFMHTTAKTGYQGREQSTSDSNYWIGSMGWGSTDFDTVFRYGSGFIDGWSTPANTPSGTSHWVGFNALHYNSGTTDYGWQMIMGAGTNGLLFVRGKWNNAGSWAKVWNADNDGSGSGLDADLLDGANSAENGGSTIHKLASNGYSQLQNWTNVAGDGLYSSSVNGFHFYPNAGSSYASARVNGSRGGYGGLYDSYGAVHWMFDSSGNGGNYRQTNSRWYDYHHVANNCTGITASTTSSSYSLYVTGAIYATGDIVGSSDERLKKNIKVIDNGLEKVLALRGVTYEWKDSEHDNDSSSTNTTPERMGVIAQELLDIVPEVVTHDKENDRYGVEYGHLTGLLIEAIKDLNKKVEDLEKKLEEK